MPDTVTLTLERALAAYSRGDNATGLDLCQSVLPVAPSRADAWNLHGALLRQRGELVRATASFCQAIAVAPDLADPQANLGNCLKLTGDLPGAVAAYEAALRLRPSWAATWGELCDAQRLAGASEQAVASGRRAILEDPASAPVRNHLANALLGAGELAAALENYRRAVALSPATAQFHCNLGTALNKAGDADAARAAWQEAMRLDPTDTLSRFSLGVCLHQQADTQGAATLYEEVLARDPRHFGACINLATVHYARGELERAQEHYRRCIELDALHVPSHYGLAISAHLRGALDEAERGYHRCLELDPGHAEASYHLGNLCVARNDGPAATAWFQRCAELDPGNLAAEAMALRGRLECCDWSVMDRAHTLVDRLLDPAVEGTAPSPFSFLAYPFAIGEAQLLQLARRRARQLAAPITALAPRVRGARTRLRIGYASSDFYNHATAHLMLGLFQRHDRARVEVHAYSFGPNDGSDYRHRIEADCDRFHELAGRNAAQIAEAVSRDDIDILVDLKGYTRDCRTEIFAHRPAPIQVQYLGYPGTLGADFMDYVITDRVVTPPAQQPFYSERFAYLPHSYQVNDREQPISEEALTREQCGLPACGFVFCCFCAAYKIEPGIFGLWMRLLRRVPDSVLWLMKGPGRTADNLRLEAASRGVDSSRLIFAPVMGKDRHLARLRNADLFLDTYYYNGHTTASDALWAGVPVVSTPGETFASRVGASLLQAVDMPGLIAPDLERYEELAVALATNPERLRHERARLAAARLTTPLFDTDAFARDLETLYQDLWQKP